MGVALAGIAFRSKDASQSVEALVSNLFASPCYEIAAPRGREFDIRRPTDVMVEFFDDVCFVYSDALIWDVLDNPDADVGHIAAKLGNPEVLLGFCHYDSGGSYGYVFVENGVRTRSRLQTTDLPNHPPIQEHGVPKAFETRWLSAPSYLEEDESAPPEDLVRVYYLEAENLHVADFALTSHLLYEALIENFGVCPWGSDARSKPRFFKLGTKATESTPSNEVVDKANGERDSEQSKAFGTPGQMSHGTSKRFSLASVLNLLRRR
ncbi:MAG: hypothetical protein QM625_10375 [Ralstonia sp.]|jgi:hypothetical protein|uniref:Uncharacterized protein n=2 Tax=Ralstonia pickettii TaxID=329 RepID=A0A2P4REM8_RALPI|nr:MULTISPECIES: hypothetical protein [Ralstonia]MBA4232278.1 hypothetical protein [Ralstonia sp.]MBA4236706.1 hypothetical protein [Ralstonia sp.]MBA4403323.1 hypothetical protein [Ralstonia sp.]MBA9847584.1 hypothetical protein [Ralstonia pickettii]MBA9852951.1 hypothetical protein [Ralstonia pickettii]